MHAKTPRGALTSAPTTTRHTTPHCGQLVRDAHRARLLDTVARMGYITVADAALLWHERTATAARAAAARAVAGCVQDKLLIGRSMPEASTVIYGLTESGARWLRSHGMKGARATTRVLAEASHVQHRGASTRIVLAAQARGARALGERELLQRRTMLDQQYGKVPDALCSWDEGTWASWHEVDWSRRSAADGKRLTRLVRAFSEVPRLATGEQLALIVVHARTPHIARTAMLAIEAIEHARPWAHGTYLVPCRGGGELLVIVDLLPPATAWHTDELLPWRSGFHELPELLPVPPVPARHIPTRDDDDRDED